MLGMSILMSFFVVKCLSVGSFVHILKPGVFFVANVYCFGVSHYNVLILGPDVLFFGGGTQCPFCVPL